MIPQPITLQGRTGTIVYMNAFWHPVTPEQASMAKVVFDDGSVAFYFTDDQGPEGLGGLTRKFDAAAHPRGEDGRFIEASQPRIFNRPEEIGKETSWGETTWRWIDKETGKPGGHLLTGVPLAPESLPETLYHVTTNAPAVESSGVLLGLLEDGGLGGGQAPGVSFTSSPESARVIERELRRSVEIARGTVNEKVFNFYARADEEEARLPKGSLDYAVSQAMQAWESNQHVLEGQYVSGKERKDTPYSPEEHERVRRSLMKDAFNSYLWARETAAEKATGQPVSMLKNPILFGQQQHLAKLLPENVRTLTIPSANIPTGALITTGSDKFLHEVRAYSDVPLWKKLQSVAKFDEAEHPREPSGSDKGGQFAETGRAGEPTPHPALARDAKVGIAAVEKLIPEAVTSASYKTNKAISTWYELDDETQDKVRQSWMEEQYENGVDVDATQLQEEFRSEIQKNNQEALDAAVENLSERFKSTRLQAKFKDPDPTLPIATDPKEWVEGLFGANPPFDLHRVLDLDTLDYGEGEHEEAGWLPSGRRNRGGTVKLDLEALRFTSGEALTKAEQLVVQEEWDQAYSYEYQRLVENALSSDEYDRRYSALEGELVQQGWDNLSDEEKFSFMQRRQFASVLTLKPGEPKQWVTGVEEGEHGDDNYNRTHAIALRLTELRTDELRKERGLLDPTEKPTYTVEQAKDYTPKRPNFVAHDAYGRVIAASNTLEQATANAEEWAKSVSERQGKVETKKLIADVWGAWKSSSSEGLSMSMQLAAAQEFDGLHRMTPEEVQQAEIDAIPYGGIETLKAYVRAQWETTQMVMAKAQEDRIEVYRGLMLEGSKVNKTPNVTLSPEGKPLEPPTNIKVEKDTSFGGIPVKNTKPWAIRETVTFDYGGEHLTTLKERLTTPGAWAEVTAEVQKQVREEWAKNAKQVTDELAKEHAGDPAYSYDKAIQTFEKFPDTTKMKLLIDWRQIGSLPPEPFESTEAAVSRRVISYHADREHPVIVKLPEMKILRAGAQSTTGTPSVANEWGGVGKVPDDAVRVVIRISAPPTSVLALPVYGQNMFEEHESVLLGTRDKWLWDAWRDKAPKFETYPISEAARKAEADTLVIDLQAEDRGKPHWMNGVDWSKVEKREYVREPAGSEHGGEFAETRQGARAVLMDVIDGGPVGVDDHPVAIRAAHEAAVVLREMKDKGYTMPPEVDVRVQQGRKATSGEVAERGVLLIKVPDNLPPDMTLDEASSIAYGGSVAVVEDGKLLGEIPKFAGKTFRDLVIHEMGHINRTYEKTVEYIPRLKNRAEAEVSAKAFTEEMKAIKKFEHAAKTSVSNYAATNPDEYVAEVFTILYNGGTLPQETVDIYHALRGAKIR